MIEVWKDIRGFKGYYQVSNLGRVRSLDRKIWDGAFYQFKKGRILKPQLNPSGYYRVDLTNDTMGRSFAVHRLVADAFLRVNYKKTFVNHKDGNKLNNRIDNLEWCTQLENIRHAFRLGLRKRKRYCIKPVICVETGERFESIRQASRAKDISTTSLLYCLKGVTKTSAGFHWKYV